VGAGPNSEPGFVGAPFLYREVFIWELPWMDDIRCATKPVRLPVALVREKVLAMIAQRGRTMLSVMVSGR
jgi:hypothetical protein